MLIILGNVCKSLIGCGHKNIEWITICFSTFVIGVFTCYPLDNVSNLKGQIYFSLPVGSQLNDFFFSVIVDRFGFAVL